MLSRREDVQLEEVPELRRVWGVVAEPAHATVDLNYRAWGGRTVTHVEAFTGSDVDQHRALSGAPGVSSRAPLPEHAGTRVVARPQLNRRPIGRAAVCVVQAFARRPVHDMETFGTRSRCGGTPVLRVVGAVAVGLRNLCAVPRADWLNAEVDVACK